MVYALIPVLAMLSLFALELIYELIEAADETARECQKCTILDTGMSRRESARIVRKLLKEDKKPRCYRW